MDNNKIKIIFWIITAAIFSIESLRISIDTINIKPFLIWLPFVILPLVYYGAKNDKLVIPANAVWLIAWTFSMLFAFMTGNVISKFDTIFILTAQIVLITIYVSIYSFSNKDIQVASSIIKGFRIFGLLAAFIGIFQVILFELISSKWGIDSFKTYGFPRATSLFSEPDWFGLYSGMCFLLVYSINKPGVRRNIEMLILIAAILASGSRTPFVALAAVLFIHNILCSKRKAKVVKLFLYGTSAVLLAGVLALTLPQKMISRFDPSTALHSDQGAFNSRLYTMYLSIYYIERNPWFGNGAGGLGYLSTLPEIKKEYASGGEMNSGRGGSNLILTQLFDVGIVGTMLSIIFFINLIKSSIIIMRRTLPSKQSLDSIMLYLACAILYFFIECMVNNMIRYVIVWVHFGLLEGVLVYRSSISKIGYKNESLEIS